MITAALVALSTGAVWYGQGKYRERELAEISSMLECVLDGREFPEYVPCRETLSSKIQHQLSRLQRMTKGYHARLEQDRDSIKNLITEIAHQMRTPLTNIGCTNKSLVILRLYKPLSRMKTCNFILHNNVFA